MAGSLQGIRETAAARDGTLTTGRSTGLVESEPQSSCERANARRLSMRWRSFACAAVPAERHLSERAGCHCGRSLPNRLFPARTKTSRPARVGAAQRVHRPAWARLAIAAATMPQACVAAAWPAMALTPCSRRSMTNPSGGPDTHRSGRRPRNRPRSVSLAALTPVAAHQLSGNQLPRSVPQRRV
jgi:hypothetical protein